MKKIICFMLALVMVLSLAACGNKTPETPTTSPANVTTPPSEAPDAEEENSSENEDIFTVENLLRNNASTVTFDTLNDYEQKLHELGFVEFKADLWRTNPEKPAMSPIELTFNETAFRLVFDYASIDAKTNEEIVVTNWVMYGTKADSALNVSNFQAADFAVCDRVDVSAMNPSDNGFVHMVNYMMYNVENDTPVNFVLCESYHYPSSNNVYNFVYQYEDALGGGYATPQVLATTEEDIDAVVDWDYYHDMEPPADAKPSPHMTIRCGNMDYLYYYREGMTIAEWASDVNYDIDGWSIVSDGTCLSPDDKYVITDVNTPIEDMVDENGVIVAERSMF